MTERPSLEEALAAPGPGDQPVPKRAAPRGWEPGYRWDGEQGTLTTTAIAERPKTWDAFITDAGLDPAEVSVVGPVQVRGWDAPAGGGDIIRMHYYRLTLERTRTSGPPLADLLALIIRDRPKKLLPVTAPDPVAFVYLAGDYQWGKVDGDGVEGTLQRALTSVDVAAARLYALQKANPIGQVHIGFLGDCVEGAQSQGGANIWRMGLTITEQIRITRRVMLHTIRVLTPLAPKATVVSVPGNHDEAIRINGKGTTRYDDSHAIDALSAVADVLAENPKTYGHVQIFTPGKDELTVTLDVAGTVIVHAHGHQWRPNKHFDWWKGQAFADHPAGAGHILASGHLHHLHLDTSSRRTFIGVPALESESTWWRHRTGETGNPGAVTLLTGGGTWSDLAVG